MEQRNESRRERVLRILLIFAMCLLSILPANFNFPSSAPMVLGILIGIFGPLMSYENAPIWLMLFSLPMPLILFFNLVMVFKPHPSIRILYRFCLLAVLLGSLVWTIFTQPRWHEYNIWFHLLVAIIAVIFEVVIAIHAYNRPIRMRSDQS